MGQAVRFERITALHKYPCIRGPSAVLPSS
jgi:hypothetical protein